MNNDPKLSDKNPAMLTIGCLMVGLLPIVIFLIALSGNYSNQPPDIVFLLVLCILCNSLGGFGCARNVTNWVARFFLGLFLAFCFFVLSVVAGLFIACSHMQF